MTMPRSRSNSMTPRFFSSRNMMDAILITETSRLRCFLGVSIVGQCGCWNFFRPDVAVGVHVVEHDANHASLALQRSALLLYLLNQEGENIIERGKLGAGRQYLLL